MFPKLIDITLSPQHNLTILFFMTEPRCERQYFCEWKTIRLLTTIIISLTISVFAVDSWLLRPISTYYLLVFHYPIYVRLKYIYFKFFIRKNRYEVFYRWKGKKLGWMSFQERGACLSLNYRSVVHFLCTNVII